MFSASTTEGGTMITISLAGEPVAKGRPRASLRRARGGKLRIHMRTPDKTASYEERVRAAARTEVETLSGLMSLPFDGPVRIDLLAVFEPPASWSQKKRAAAIGREIAHTVRPDLDNILKAWLDALNGIVYRDDTQVVRVVAEKRYGPQALVAVFVARAQDASAYKLNHLIEARR
jgi:Holliday junction resolvase RusA-like endonuclease